MSDNNGERVRQPVTPEEVEAAYKIPAPGANKFVVTISQPGVRISFGELHPLFKVPVFFSAVTLHPVDAIALNKLLSEMLTGIEDKIVSVEVN